VCIHVVIVFASLSYATARAGKRCFSLCFRSGSRKPVNNTKYYELLGIDKSASADAIKKAFRKAAMTHHPDKGGDPEKVWSGSDLSALCGSQLMRCVVRSSRSCSAPMRFLLIPTRRRSMVGNCSLQSYSGFSRSMG
jgi:hypothetical protein